METTININDITENDLHWKIDYNPDRCTRCGRCIATCTFGALEMTVERRAFTVSTSQTPTPQRSFDVRPVVKQVSTLKNHCVGCAMCEKVCPNVAIRPVRNDETREALLNHPGGSPVKRGGEQISALSEPSIPSKWAEFLR